MRLKGAKQVHYDSGPNMTPLVDVVMVILIFLMLAGSFASAEHFLASNLPFKEGGVGGAAAPSNFVPDEPLEIRIDSPASGRYVARAGQISVDNSKALTQQLTAMQQALERAGTPPEKVQVVIKPGKDVQYRFLIEVYEAAMRAKFSKIAFAQSH